jgi:hypothetical protein
MSQIQTLLEDLDSNVRAVQRIVAEDKLVSVSDDGYLTTSIAMTNWDWSNDRELLLTKLERRLRERNMGFLRSASLDSFDGDSSLEKDSLISSRHGELTGHLYFR